MFSLAGRRGDGDFFGTDEGVDCGGFSNIGIADQADLGSAGVGWICDIVCGVLDGISREFIEKGRDWW